jgi:hypothetical protein
MPHPYCDNCMNSKALLSQLKIFLYYLCAIFLVINYLFLIVWTYCYSLYVGYLLLAAFMAAIIIFIVNRSKRQSVKFLLLGALLFLLLLPFNLKQYNRKAASFQARINNNGELNTRERLGIYGCLMMVTAFDLIPFPEVGEENFYLFFSDQDSTRVFYSNAILNSPSIMREVKRETSGLVTWNKWATVFNPDFRYAVAFDPCIIKTEQKENYREVTLTRRFEYRKNHVTTHANNFARGWFAFRIDEGLFWYLQERGWLHPYTAIWKAKLSD